MELLDLFRDPLADVAATGRLRDDIAPDELAGYCLHVLAAAGGLPSESAVQRFVMVTLDGLRPAGGTVTTGNGLPRAPRALTAGDGRCPPRRIRVSARGTSRPAMPGGVRRAGPWP